MRRPRRRWQLADWGVHGDLGWIAALLIAVTATSTTAIVLSQLGLPSWVDAILCVVVTGAVGGALGRAAGLTAAVLSSLWFALALTEPAYRPRIDRPSEIILTVVVLVAGMVVAPVGDIVRAWQEQRRRRDEGEP